MKIFVSGSDKLDRTENRCQDIVEAIKRVSAFPNINPSRKSSGSRDAPASAFHHPAQHYVPT